MSDDASVFVPPQYTRNMGGAVLRGAETQNLNQFSLTDKIINLKLVRRFGQPIVIRSDYEVAFRPDGKPQFIPIKQKPAIHIKYNQVANTTAINVDIHITNLFILNPRAGKEIFEYHGNPIVSCTIQMGYRHQFPDWTQVPMNYDTEDSADPEHPQNRLKLFYELDGFTITNAREEMVTALNIINVQVLAIQPQSLPPDRVIYVQGIIGTLQRGLVWQRSSTNAFFAAEYMRTNENFPQLPARREALPLTNLERILFQYITRRYLRSKGVLAITDDSDPNEPKLFVLDYIPSEDEGVPGTFNTDPARFATAPSILVDKNTASPTFGKLVPQARWVEVPLEDGLLRVQDAVVLGVHCILSDGLLALDAEDMLVPSATQGEEPEQTRNTPTIAFHDMIGAQIIGIIDTYPDIRFFQSTNGDFLLFHVRETLPELVAGQEVIPMQRQLRSVILPAVYDISIGALRTIRCPFVGFITTMQIVGFSSRYMIGDFVGFYYPHPDLAWYRVLLAEIEFDTTDDKNIMILECTDIARTDPPIRGRDTITIIQTERTLAWREIAIVPWRSRPESNMRVRLHPDDPNTVDTASTWEEIATRFVLENPQVNNAPDGPNFERNASGGWSLPTKGEAIMWIINTDERNKENNEAWLVEFGPIERRPPAVVDMTIINRFGGKIAPGTVAMIHPTEDKGQIVYVPYTEVTTEQQIIELTEVEANA